MAGSSPLEVFTIRERGELQDPLTLLSAVADPVRWTVVRHLAVHGTTCVCELQERVPVAANLLSYHLKVLREAGVVTSSRRGRWVDYTVAPDAHARLVAALPVVAARSVT